MNDEYDLQRFLDAQEPVFETALSQLCNGRKRSHWMWFVFPQLKGLGHSEMAQRYGISGREEALAYLQHPCLGARLESCCSALLQWRQRSATEIMGSPDDLKLRSSMTLFASVAPQSPLFQKVIDAFFGGTPDSATVSRLRQG
ncbi:DUF1810 domain-containing protein [Pseudomonas sp. LP_7_YM]|uniref:DUF1810 domain-containing protein n=1 Tax=Pseudomonas sp. LP_7_YM TaxID=2485137 RepID=UPI001061A52F|nr:DUF1810 domain-containing protein [Pseudomonas sp. LP_7_YM]TDV60785.1 uncharacterized protein (DUF1810 family) [Pseudomonas sp. LP_7_YM]